MKNNLDFKINFFNLIKFTFPSIFMMLIVCLYTVIDGVFVARILGTEALSAVNIIYPLISTVIAVGTMFSSGLTAIVSIKLGEEKREEAKKDFTFMSIVGILLGVIVTILSLTFLNEIIYLLGADNKIFNYCYQYALPLIYTFPLYIIQLIFQSLYIVNAKPTTGLIVTTISGVINIVLHYIFMVKLNFGIIGASIATNFGCGFSAIFGFIYFSINRRGNIYFTKPQISYTTFFNTITNGSSEMVSYLSASITTFIFNIILMKLIGTDGVAAITILLYIDYILVAVNLGYSMGVSPLISYNYGAKRYSTLKKLYNLSIKLCFGFGLFLTIFSIISSKNLVSIFAKENSSVFLLAVFGLKIYSLSYIFKGYNIFSSAMFTAFGNGKISAIISFMRTLVFLTLSLVVLSILFKTTGVWSAAPVAEALSFILAMFFTIKYSKKYSYL